MKAAQFNQYGNPDNIVIKDNAEKPQISDKQILVEVFAASINPVESAIRNGYMREMLPLNFPVNLGGDFSGVVTEKGDDVSNFKKGDEVYGVANPFKGGSGSIAEFVSANAINTGLKPKSISHTEAASLPLVGASALQAIEEHVKLQAGQKILIHGGAGGIGTLAIQIAKMHGAYVATTASSTDADFLKELGADEVIDYKTQDFATIINDYDAVFDTVGGEITNKSISVLKKGGILVSMAGQPDQDLTKQHEVTALTQMTIASTEQLTRLRELIDSEKIKPVVDKTFSLDQSREAYEYLETNHPKGKIGITLK